MATVPKKKPPAKKVPAKKAPAPAKDLKPGDSRSSYLKRASNNPVGDFLKEAQKARQLPVVTEQPKKVRGNPNMARPSKVIKQGYTPGSASRAVVPYQGAAKRGIAAAAGIALRTAVRYAGPVGALVGMTTEVGAGSDKPSGPLFSPSKNRAAGKGNPKAVNPYKVAAAGGGPRSRQGSSSPSMAANSVASNSYFKDVPSYKGAKAKSTVEDFKEKNLAANQKVGKKDKPAVPVKRKAPAFKGNWTGAAPTEMQKRGGQKSMRPNLLDLIRNKKK